MPQKRDSEKMPRSHHTVWESQKWLQVTSSTSPQNATACDNLKWRPYNVGLGTAKPLPEPLDKHYRSHQLRGIFSK